MQPDAESLVIVKLTPSTNPIVTNAVAMTVAAIFLAGLSLAAGERWVLPQQSDTVVAIAYLVLGGSVTVFGLYVFILARWSASATSYSLLLVPLATVVYGSVLLGEEISSTFLVGGLTILIGVWLGVLAPERWLAWHRRSGPEPTDSGATDGRRSVETPFAGCGGS